MKQKQIRFDVKSLNDNGTFTGFAAVYGNVDQGNDVIDPGAFKTTLAARGGRVPLLYQHNPREPIGIGNLTDSEKGLVIEGKLVLSVPRAKEAYDLLKEEVLRGLSIGYEVVQEKMVGGVRYLKEIKLFEVSLVTFPMNELALVTGVKSDAEWDELFKQMEETLPKNADLFKKFEALSGKLLPAAAMKQGVDPKAGLQSAFAVQLPTFGD